MLNMFLLKPNAKIRFFFQLFTIFFAQNHLTGPIALIHTRLQPFSPSVHQPISPPRLSIRLRQIPP